MTTVYKAKIYNTIPLASKMVTTVYQSQYELLCSKVFTQIVNDANKGLTKTTIVDYWKNAHKYPLVDSNAFVNELKTKGYDTKTDGEHLEISWEGVKADPNYYAIQAPWMSECGAMINAD